MEQFNNLVYNYIRVDGDYLKETNDNTRKIWDEALTDGIYDIIKMTNEDEEDNIYLVEPSVYYNLIQASKEGEDVDPYGIANVNFTLINRTDSRWKKYHEQRLKRGFDDSETWSLDSTITKFILPRLKRFREIKNCYPPNLTETEWDCVLDKIIMAFERLDDKNIDKDFNEVRNKIIDEGLKLFIEYYSGLWW